MPKWSTTVTSLLGLAICGGVIWVAASAQPGAVPAGAVPKQQSPSTTVVAPPTTTQPDTAETGQFRVYTPEPLPPVSGEQRDPVKAGPPTGFQHRDAPTRAPDYMKRMPPWVPRYPPPPGTSPREFYLHCLRQADRFDAPKAELTCQYLADSL